MHEAEVCLKCHLDNPDVRNRVGPSAQFIASYERSAHATAMKEGKIAAATCSDCHGGHEMKKGSTATSKVFKMNIAATCGQAGCHGTETKEFDESVHGVALLKGNKDSPTCTDCHGQHQIFQHADPRSPVAKLNLAAQVCSPCHSSVKMAEKYGLPADKYKSYVDSYHGLAVRGGSSVAANCASCHGVHTIKPSSDPTSTIHKANLAKTCGQCHPGANENFTRGAVHTTTSANSDNGLIYWISTLYIVLIFSIVGGMFLHNLFDFVRKSKRKLEHRRHPHLEPEYGTGLYVRMTLSERLQHGGMLISFVTLVITGFALAYPDAWWVRHIREFFGESAFELRGILHRIAAVVMIAASLWHLYYILFVPRGKQLIRDLMPKLQDARDAIAVLKYNFGFSKTKPKFGRFSYIEKSEYWALVWGSVVMILTGFILWFDNTFLGLFSKLFVDVATTIHYYEAWLATLAIIIWHIYFVIFNPDVYPMNLAWLKGTITEEEMEEEHPLELEKIKKEMAEKEAKETVSEEENLKWSSASP
jgi:formate dehydrogenase gamma subunit